MKMNLKKILGDGLKTFICLIAACFVGYFISNGVFGLIASSTSNSRLVIQLFNFIPFFLIMLTVLFVFCCRVEYKREQFSLGESCISSAIACAFQLLFAVLVVYAIYTCGPALSLAKIIYAGNDTNAVISDTDIPGHLYVICMVILDIFYIAVSVLGGYVGQKKREKERSSTLKS